jgi:chromosome partitioning protein
MAAVITIANTKGGSGKTSTAVNLGFALAITHRRVLLVDTDPQSSATVALGFDRADDSHSLAGVLISGNPISDIVLKYNRGLFDVIPANEDLTAVQVALYSEADGRIRLRKALSALRDLYDFIIIDSPASQGLLTVNALCAADSMIIPTPCDYFAIDSLMQITKLFESLKSSGDASLKLLGVLRTMYDEHSALASSISRELEQQFGQLLFHTVIPYTERVNEASASGRPLLLYDKSSVASKSYLELAGEIIGKLRKGPVTI